MRLVIVGGSDAGIAAALRARELGPGAAVAVLVADRFPNHSVAHIGRRELEQTGMTLHLDTPVTRIDPGARTVDHAGGELA